jgi:hypothetical protein
MVKLSPSALSLFSECPRCFWMNHNAQIKRPQQIFPSLPGGIDRVLKEYFDAHITQLGANGEHGQLPRELIELQNEGYTLFTDMQKLDIWRNNFRGISYTDTNGNTLMGAVDTILKLGELLVVLDFKTKGSEPNELSHTYYVTQLSIYNWLLAQNGYDVSDHGFLLFYYPTQIPSANLVHFGSKLVKVYCEEDVPKLFSDALSCLTLTKPPASSSQCQFCDWHLKVHKKEMDEQQSTQKKLQNFLS